MESVGIQGQKANRRFVFFASIASFVGALLLLQIPYVELIEARAYDFCFRAAHWAKGHVEAPKDIGMVAIDDKAVNPDYSTYSSKYGDDGWRTRDLWDLHVKQMGQIYFPKVLAYDILFSPVATKAVLPDQKNVPIMRKLELDGNKEFLNSLIDFDEARSQGLPAPRALFAYYFPDNIEGSTNLNSDELAKQEKWFAKLNRFRLPPGSVAPGGNAPVFRSVWLPMEEILMAPSYYLGAINIKPDVDGVHRRAPMIYAYQPPGSAEVRYVPGFALEAFLLWLDIEPQDLKKPGEGLPSLSIQPGGDLKITSAKGVWTLPIDDQFQMAIVPRFKFKTAASPGGLASRNESGPGIKIDTEIFEPSFVDLLDPGLVKATPQQIAAVTKDRILLVAEAFTGGTDSGDFPLEVGAPNALLHLQILENILQNDHLVPVSFFLKALICAVLAAIMAWLYLWAPIRLAGLWSVTLILCYPVLAAVTLIGRNVELPLIAPTLLCASCFGLNSYQIYQVTRRGRETMRRLFSSVTSPRVLRLLEENPDAFYVHRKTEATMLFSDVEGFTSLSEKLDPDYLASLINRYLSPMTEIVIRHDGYLIQYAGDGIMAVWGVPLPDVGHEAKACIAAWEQLQAAKALTEVLPDGKPYQFKIRIGINTGMISAGNMGSAQKMQYTVMGDDVNLAARLEPASKDYGTQIILGPRTYAGAKDHIRARALDKIIVKGRTEAVLIYELLGLAESPAPREWAAAYEEGLECLWRRQWDAADVFFEKAIRLRGGDSPSELQRARIREYRVHPPAANWQGEFTRLAKD